MTDPGNEVGILLYFYSLPVLCLVAYVNLTYMSSSLLFSSLPFPSLVLSCLALSCLVLSRLILSCCFYREHLQLQISLASKTSLTYFSQFSLTSTQESFGFAY